MNLPLAALDAGSGWHAPFILFFALLIGHAIADYPMQGTFLATAKDRHGDSSALFGKQGPPPGMWIHALTAHSLIHAGFVWVITGSALLAAVESILHWAIDFVKCEGLTRFTTDQLLHVACKAVYAIILGFGWLSIR
jgi:hypothetical protein